jgi:hypothetical protein
MAKITYIEREYIERILKMKGGYVLDFSNRTFKEFLLQIIKVDVYGQYEYESKAKLLRRIFDDFDDKSVGKLLMELLRYKKEHSGIKEEEKKDFNKSLEIAYKLLGKTPPKNNKTKTITNKRKNFDFESTKKNLTAILNIKIPQNRGFEFEKFLFRFFKDNDLNPRASFRIIGEQIDGSFEFENEIYLLEAKWTFEKTSKSDLVVFNEKVSSKSSFTRGIFISFSGFSDNAIQTFNDGRVVRIILVTVQELAIALERNINFTKLLKFKIRGLAEEGNCFKDAILL